jgi:hypothetical protein
MVEKKKKKKKRKKKKLTNDVKWPLRANTLTL